MSRFQSQMRFLSRGNMQPVTMNAQPLFIYQSQMQSMRGAGIGSIFSNIYSSVMPFIKSAFRIGSKAAKSKVGRSLAKKAKKKAMKAGLNVVSDALQGKNVINSTKRELNKAKQEVKKGISKRVNAAADAALHAALSPDRSIKPSKLNRKRPYIATPGNLIRRDIARKKKKKDIFDI